MIVEYRLRQQSPEAVPASDAVAAQIWQQITTVIESLDNPAELQAVVAAIRQLSNFNLQHAQVSPLNSLILFHRLKSDIMTALVRHRLTTYVLSRPSFDEFCLVRVGDVNKLLCLAYKRSSGDEIPERDVYLYILFIQLINPHQQ